MKIVVDTNLIFSALVNTNSRIGDLMFNSEKFFKYYSCSYMRFEIEKHWEKLLKASKLNDNELRESQYRLYSKLHFINEELISPEIWAYSEKTISDIDIDDIDFLALKKYLNGYLWTGDKFLYEGLKAKKISKIINAQELFEIREMKMKHNS